MSNKTVLVTGGAKGIGKAICEKFASQGYNVLINYKTSKEAAEKLKTDLLKSYSNIDVEIYECDVSIRDNVSKMVDFAVKRFNSIDVLVNNAGISLTKIFNDITTEEFDNIINTNLKGTFNVIKETLNKCMINKKNGAIVNISSIWGRVGSSMETLYSSSKFGIIGMSKSLAKELGPSNIRVNVVCPGWIETDMNKKYTINDKENFINDVPLGRLGNVCDVANAVYFLASTDASYITGQVINVDGGYLS